MSSYFELALVAKRNLTSAETKVALQLNHKQYGYLCQIIEDAIDSARLVNSKRHDGVYDGILRELYFTLERADILVEKCCNKRWLQSTITQADTIQHFSTLISAIELCNSLLLRDLDTKGSTLLRGRNDILSKNLKRKTSLDQLFILEKLRVVLQEPKSTEEERLLSSYLLQKYENDLTGSAEKSPSFPGRYKVKAQDLKTGCKLGQSSSSVVYETTWLGERFARKDYIVTNRNIFEDEAAVLVGLLHVNIVHTFCWSIDTRVCSLVMELMAENMHTFVQKRKDFNRQKGRYDDVPFEMHEAVHIMLQIASGMRYLHEHGMAHGKMKPTNILVNPVKLNGGHVNVKVSDFGVSNTEMRSSLLLGSKNHVDMLLWEAPDMREKLPGHSTKDFDKSFTSSEMDLAEGLMPDSRLAKADVYSYSIICFLILTGEVPSSLLSSELLHTCPLKLVDLIQRCWNTNHEQRPTFHNICEELESIQVTLITEKSLNVRYLEKVLGENRPQDYLDLSQTVMDRIISKQKTSAVQLNQMQYEYLCRKIGDAIGSARSVASKRFDGVLRHLCFTIERAEVLVENYCNDHWLEFAITQEDSSQEFVRLISAMNLCDSLFVQSVEGLELIDLGPVDSRDNLNIQLYDILKKDKRSLILKLEVKYSAPDSTEEEQLLTQYLLQAVLPRRTFEKPDLQWYKVDTRDLESGQCLGKGGSGIIYETTWLGEKFARKDFPGTNNEVFEREAARLVGLWHFNIVHTFCWSVDTRGGSLVMDLMAEDLQTFVLKRKEFNMQKAASVNSLLELHEAIHIILEIANGMKYLGT